MAEVAIARREGSIGSRIDWGRALVAGLVATILMTITMALFGMNLMKSLGGMILGADASTAMQYLVGGLIHFMIGIGYGLVYAALVAPRLSWHPVLKGAVYGAALTVIALVMMPVMASALGGGAGNPCNPCNPTGGATAGAANPCNPCGGGGNPVTSGLISLLNHLVYGITQALLYGSGAATLAVRRD